MSQTKALEVAREHLARAESALGSAEGLARLEQGLALLDEVDAPVARNLEATYAARIIGSIAARLERDRAVPEPVLEHFFKTALALDESRSPPPDDARAVKIRIARRLIDYYCEGQTAEEKERATAALMQVAGVRPGGAPKRRSNRVGRKRS
jgi:hypothetical protein